MILSFHNPPTPAQLDTWVADRDYTVMQTSEPVPDSVWPLLNERFFSRRPDVRLRVYGFYGQACDLSFAPQMTNVLDFAADCLADVTGVEHLPKMTWLKKLSYGVYHAENFDFLDEMPIGLESLALTPSKSKKPSVKSISRFKRLRKLILSGQQNGIESASELSELEELMLSGISVPGLDFLSGLNRLHSLEFWLGGTRNLGALSRVSSLRRLQIVQIQKFEDLSPVAEMTALERLHLSSLPLISRLPNLSGMRDLKTLTLDSLKSLGSLTEVAMAPNLENFLYKGATLAAEKFEPLLDKPSIRKMGVYTGSTKFNEAMAVEIDRRGLTAGAGVFY